LEVSHKILLEKVECSWDEIWDFRERRWLSNNHRSERRHLDEDSIEVVWTTILAAEISLSAENKLRLRCIVDLDPEKN
jgi:hypothetical protein